MGQSSRHHGGQSVGGVRVGGTRVWAGPECGRGQSVGRAL